MEAPKMPEGIDPAKTIDLQFNRIFCSRHGEPYRAKWPKGFLLFAIPGVKKLMLRDDFADEWEKYLDECGKSDQRAIERALDGFPLCCRLGQKDLMELYVESGIGVMKVCGNCFKTAIGSPYKTQRRDYQHLCFNCVINNYRKD